MQSATLLFTALRLNALTHEYFTRIFVLNDRIYRSKIIKIYGEDVKFIKIKPHLTEFGIINRGEIRYSDLEKNPPGFSLPFKVQPKT